MKITSILKKVQAKKAIVIIAVVFGLFLLGAVAYAGLHNRPPQIKSLEPANKSTSYQGDKITFKANASDPDGDKLSYRFLIDNKPVNNWSASNQLSWTSSDTKPKLYKLIVQVKDRQKTVSKTNEFFLYLRATAPHS